MMWLNQQLPLSFPYVFGHILGVCQSERLHPIIMMLNGLSNILFIAS
jgi:hypothetical protein